MNSYQTEEAPVRVRGPRRTAFILLVAFGLLASAVMAFVVWVPDDWKPVRSYYNPEFRTCYGISKENPALRDTCGYEGRQTDCIMSVSGALPRVCYGILR